MKRHAAIAAVDCLTIREHVGNSPNVALTSSETEIRGYTRPSRRPGLLHSAVGKSALRHRHLRDAKTRPGEPTLDVGAHPTDAYTVEYNALIRAFPTTEKLIGSLPEPAIIGCSPDEDASGQYG